MQYGIKAISLGLYTFWSLPISSSVDSRSQSQIQVFPLLVITSSDDACAKPPNTSPHFYSRDPRSTLRSTPDQPLHSVSVLRRHPTINSDPKNHCPHLSLSSIHHLFCCTQPELSFNLDPSHRSSTLVSSQSNVALTPQTAPLLVDLIYDSHFYRWFVIGLNQHTPAQIRFKPICLPSLSAIIATPTLRPQPNLL